MLSSSLLMRATLFALTAFSIAQASSNLEQTAIKKEVSIQKIEVRSKSDLEVNIANKSSNLKEQQGKGLWDKLVDKTKELSEGGVEAISSTASSAWESTKKATKSVANKATNYVKDYFKSSWEEAGKNIKKQEEQQKNRQ